jgi:hypothetical protein
MVRRWVLASVVACLVALTAAGQAWGSDASSTASYLRANYALVAAGHAHLGASIAGYKGVLSKVRSRCPHAGEGSPQNPMSTELSNEVIGAMVLSAGRPDRPAIATYLRAVKGLRWSSGSVTHAVASYASMLGKLYALQVPDLCGDVHGWAATGYKTLPSTTLSFDKIFYPNWVALGLIPPGIARFESSQDRALAKSAARFEYQLTNVEAEAVETWGDVMDALELWP